MGIPEDIAGDEEAVKEFKKKAADECLERFETDTCKRLIEGVEMRDCMLDKEEGEGWPSWLERCKANSEEICKLERAEGLTDNQYLQQCRIAKKKAMEAMEKAKDAVKE